MNKIRHFTTFRHAVKQNSYSYGIEGNRFVKSVNIHQNKYTYTYQQLKDLKKGDIVENSFGKLSEIEYVIKTKIDNTIDMCSIDSVAIRPWHPIKRFGKWFFPANLVKTTSTYVDILCNFLLTPYPAINELESDIDFYEHYIMTINGLVNVVTFGNSMDKCSEYFINKKQT